MTSTDGDVPLKSSASRVLRAAKRRSTTSVRVAKGGPISSVTAAIADSRLPCVTLSSPSVTPSGSSTKANSPAPVSTEPARNASPRPAQVMRNMAQTTTAFSSVITSAAATTSHKLAHTIFMSMVMPTPMKNSASSRPRNGSISASSSWR
jgi:hypothetical protein